MTHVDQLGAISRSLILVISCAFSVEIGFLSNELSRLNGSAEEKPTRCSTNSDPRRGQEFGVSLIDYLNPADRQLAP